MDAMKISIIAAVALVVGAAGGYFYTQGQVSDLAGAVTTLEMQLGEANEKAESAAGEVEALKADLEDKNKQIEEQQATIVELEAASQAAAPASPQ